MEGNCSCNFAKDQGKEIKVITRQNNGADKIGYLYIKILTVPKLEDGSNKPNCKMICNFDKDGRWDPIPIIL